MEDKKDGKKKELKAHESLINFLLLLNLIAAVLMTMPQVMEKWEHELDLFCNISIIIFTIEIVVRMIITWKTTKNPLRFFYKETGENGLPSKWESWNIFDFVVTLLSLLLLFQFTTDVVGIRAARLLKAINGVRIIDRNDRMKIITESLFKSIPYIAGMCVYFLMLYLVYAILGISLYRETNPELFQDIGTAFYTLFKIMTLDCWTDISATLMENHPHCWLYLVSFIIIAAYLLLNIVVGILLDSMQEIRKKKNRDKWEKRQQTIDGIEQQLKEIKELLQKNNISDISKNKENEKVL